MHRTATTGLLTPTAGATWRHLLYQRCSEDGTHLLWQLVVMVESWVVYWWAWRMENLTQEVTQKAQLHAYHAHWAKLVSWRGGM